GGAVAIGRRARAAPGHLGRPVAHRGMACFPLTRRQGKPRDASQQPGDDMGWTFDPHHTIVGFSAKHLGITTVRGIFKEFTADVQLDDDGNPTTAAGRVVVKAASLDTANEQRDGHLRSADFFDVENYPDIVFVAKSVTRKSDDEYDVMGELT